jgi:hypothetical protein
MDKTKTMMISPDPVTDLKKTTVNLDVYLELVDQLDGALELINKAENALKLAQGAFNDGWAIDWAEIDRALEKIKAFKDRGSE